MRKNAQLNKQFIYLPMYKVNRQSQYYLSSSTNNFQYFGKIINWFDYVFAKCVCKHCERTALAWKHNNNNNNLCANGTPLKNLSFVCRHTHTSLREPSQILGFFYDVVVIVAPAPLSHGNVNRSFSTPMSHVACRKRTRVYKSVDQTL